MRAVLVRKLRGTRYEVVPTGTTGKVLDVDGRELTIRFDGYGIWSLPLMTAKKVLHVVDENDARIMWVWEGGAYQQIITPAATWEDLANERDKLHGGRASRTLPMESVFEWAEKSGLYKLCPISGALHRRQQ